MFLLQVDCWHPELLDIERSAKENAHLLFFVVDAQTRAVASMVEAAYFAGLARPLVLVIRQLPDVTMETKASEVELCCEEIADLNHARMFLLDMAERAGVKVFFDENMAVQFSVDVLQQKRGRPLHVDELCHERVGGSVVSAHEVFQQCLSASNHSLSVDEVVVAMRAATSKMSHSVDRQAILALLGSRKDVSFQEFLCLLAEVRHKATVAESWWLWRWFAWVRNVVQAGLEVYLERKHLFGRPPLGVATRARRITDVFLGGSCGNTTWRQELAIPLLRQHGVSYYNPQVR